MAITFSTEANQFPDNDALVDVATAVLGLILTAIGIAKGLGVI